MPVEHCVAIKMENHAAEFWICAYLSVNRFLF